MKETQTLMSLPPMPAPAVRSSVTSVTAARAIEPHLGRLEALVFAAICESPATGRTCDELEVLGKLSHQTCSARIRRLAQLGRIQDSEMQRKTRSGRPATVWVRAV